MIDEMFDRLRQNHRKAYDFSDIWFQIGRYSVIQRR